MVKNGHVGLAGDGAGEQRLAGARRADQQHALGDLAAQALELLRVLQELDDLLELLLGLVDAGDVVEGHAAVLLGQQPRPGLAEAHGLAAAGCIWRMKKIQTPISSSIGNQDTSTLNNDGTLLSSGRGDPDAAIGQAIDHIGIRRGISAERAAISEVTADRCP